MQSTPFYQPVTTQRVDYYLRSTVLGGKVVTELTSQGQKRKTNVYVGSEVAAEQILSGQTQWLVWKYRNPVTASSAEQTGSTVTKQEYDPFGLELGGSDPYLQSEQPDYASLAGGSFYRNGGNPFDGDSGCQWNGMPFPCDRLGYVIRTQHVERWEIGRNVNSSLRSNLDWIADEGKKLKPVDPDIDDNNVLKINTDDNGLGHWELLAFFFQDRPAPQKTGEISEPTSKILIIDTGGDTALERNRLKILRKIEFMVNSLACNEAFKRADLPTPFDLVNNGKITLSSTRALTSSAYNTVLGRALGALSGSLPDNVRRDALNAGTPARTLRNDRTGQSIIFFAEDAFEPSYLDEAVPHEFIHGAGQGKTYSWFGYFFGHDLSGFDAKAYAEIMANCKDH